MEGIKERLNKAKFLILPSFWLLLLFSLLLKVSYLMGLYTISVLIHELAHFFVAKKLNYKCKQITLSAFGAVLYGDFDDIDRGDSIKIAIAGPAVNAALCILTVALWWIFPATYVFTYHFALCNFFLLIINLLPCYPLDGGRIFIALAERRWGYKNSLKIARVVTVALSIILFFIFVLGILYKENLYTVGLFAVFLLLTGANETKFAIYRKQLVFDSYKRGIKRGIEKKCLVFDGNLPLSILLKKLSGNFFYEITVICDNDKTFILQQPQINKLFMGFSLDTPLKELFPQK